MKKHRTDTLAGIVTPLGEGGIGVVLLAGPNALRIASQVFRGTKVGDISRMLDNRLCHGTVRDAGGVVDEVILRLKSTPRRGHIIEINCHGGIVAVRRVLSLLIERGARQALPEELLHCALGIESADAVRCEAAKELMRVRTLLCARMLLDQFHGALSGELKRLLDGEPSREDLLRLLRTADFGIGLCIPRRIVIAGKPNVGKSTLFNRLLQEDRAIVHDLPGTTRDALAEEIEIAGVPFELIDTAGIRRTKHEVEMLGVKTTEKEIAEADIVLLVLDATRPLDADDERLMRITAPLKTITVLNKTDKATAGDLARLGTAVQAACRISALTGDGLRELNDRIHEMSGARCYVPGRPVVFTKRQRSLLEAALQAGDMKEKIKRIL